MSAPLQNSNRRKYYVGDSVEGKYKNNTYTLKKVEGNKGYFSCNVCDEDQELYPDLFSALSSQIFKQERMICGCSDHYVYNERQLRIISSRLCEENNEKYLGLENYKGCYTKLKRRCRNGHTSSINIDQYRRGKTGCLQCTRTAKKIFKGKEDKLDYLYVVSFTNGDEEVLKIGRTFNVKQRLTNLFNKTDKTFSSKLLMCYSGKHKDIVELEYGIHSNTILSDYKYTETNLGLPVNEVYEKGVLREDLFILLSDLQEEKIEWER